MKSHRTHKPLLEERAVSRTAVNRRAYPKTPKQRLDELKQAFKEFMWALDQQEDAKAREFNCPLKAAGHMYRGQGGRVLGSCFHGFGFDLFGHTRKQYEELYKNAKRDGIL